MVAKKKTVVKKVVVKKAPAKKVVTAKIVKKRVVKPLKVVKKVQTAEGKRRKKVSK